MSELPYRPEHVNDASANSEELTNEELGAYVRLQRALWRAGGYLPVAKLARFARAGRRWGAIGPAITSKLTIIDGIASCAEILDNLLRTRERRARMADRAAKGGQATAAKRRSVTQNGPTSDGGLKLSNPLKTNNVTALGATPKRGLATSNQNQSLINSKTQSKGDEAPGGREKTGGYEECVTLLTEHSGIRHLAARSQVSKWLVAVEDDAELWEITHAVAHENLRGPQFVAVIDQRINARRRERERGAALPFPPSTIAGTDTS